MQTLLTASVLLLSILMPTATSSDGTRDKVDVTLDRSALSAELIETLETNFNEQLKHYSSARNVTPSPTRLAELNQELFDLQRGPGHTQQTLDAAKPYFARARAIETIARQRLENGTGTSFDVLDAKATRLKALIALTTNPE